MQGTAFRVSDVVLGVQLQDLGVEDSGFEVYGSDSGDWRSGIHNSGV